MTSWVGGRAAATPSQLDEVVRAIYRTPIIDHHAHPLLKPEALGKNPLLSITTEASGDAIHAASTSLAHLRGVRQLSKLLRCDTTWEAVVAAIEQRRIDAHEDWIAQCFSGIETILMDDGLDNPEEAHDYQEHDVYTRSKCKRIVRIEKLAEKIIHGLVVEFKEAEKRIEDEDEEAKPLDDVEDELRDKFFRTFNDRILESIEDPEVVGFKSIVCYRGGLDIGASRDLTPNMAFSDLFDKAVKAGEFRRLEHRHLNQYLVHSTAALLRDSEARPKKPIQFHTGLGDNDINLTKSSPSYLQNFIRTYPTVPIVLLHASYPYTREAGYLGTVYDNVYVDIGEIFPFLSQDGQEKAVRQILELCPWSKILWSTDGHWFPETYVLAVTQVREALQTVICEYVKKGHIGWKAAIALVRDILFSNSNKLYQLGLQLTELEEEYLDVDSDYKTDYELLQFFLKDQIPPDFVRICWVDLTASPRMRMVPFRKFMSLLNEGKSTDIGITRAVFGLLQNDLMVPGTVATGEYRLHPDFSSLKQGPVEGHISMYGEFREQSGARVATCPRSLLERAVEFGAENNLAFLLGFEIEFLLVERLPRAHGSHRYGTLTTDGHAWSVSRYFADPKISHLLRDIVSALADTGIFVEQLHAESATGQFELILPPLPPVQAVDTLLHARDVMSALATAAGFRMTLHPKPFAHACGTASHTHMSISSSNGAKPEIYEAFYAGILKHLRGIVAFTYSNPASYDRVADGVWAGGRWVTWGTQNRETALRKIEDSHWEIKCMDGLANPYLAMGAVLMAGVHGVVGREKLVWGDCEIDPANLTENDRKELGVSQMLPGSVEEALLALKEDVELVEYLGGELVEKYVAVKEAELDYLGGMGEEERRQWIMERY